MQIPLHRAFVWAGLCGKVGKKRSKKREETGPGTGEAIAHIYIDLHVNVFYFDFPLVADKSISL